MAWSEIPGRFWLVMVSLLVSIPLMFWWSDAVLIAGIGMILGLGMTVLDIGWWPAKKYAHSDGGES